MNRSSRQLNACKASMFPSVLKTKVALSVLRSRRQMLDQSGHGNSVRRLDGARLFSQSISGIESSESGIQHGGRTGAGMSSFPVSSTKTSSSSPSAPGRIARVEVNVVKRMVCAPWGIHICQPCPNQKSCHIFTAKPTTAVARRTSRRIRTRSTFFQVVSLDQNFIVAIS